MDPNWKKIVKLLTQNHQTISTMESCTGGAVASEITNISGASDVFHEGYITYCNDAKIKLGVPSQNIEKYTVYSKETAIEMAKTAQKRAESSFGIGVIGQLGRVDPQNPQNKLLNHVWYAIAGPNNTITAKTIIVADTTRHKQKLSVTDAISSTLLELLK